MIPKTIPKWMLRSALLCAVSVLIAGFALAHPHRPAPVAAADSWQAPTLHGGHYQMSQVTLGKPQANFLPLRTSRRSADPAPGVPADPSSVTQLSGGHYQLTRVTLGGTQTGSQPLGNFASGGSYHLKASASPQLTGNGCCCTFLPCVIR